MRLRSLLFSIAVAIAGLGLAHAQPAIQPTVDITKVPAAAEPSGDFDVDAATEAYMAMMPPAAVARSNAYFEGSYWLILWDFLYASAISLLLLNAIPGRDHSNRLPARVLRELRPRA
jgi:STE24 endopeptidase